MKKILLFLLLLLTQKFLLAQETNPLLLYKDESIKPDGMLDESVWQSIPSLSGFHNFFPLNDGLARKDTEVKIFQNGKHLNIAFIYHDTTENVNVNSLKRDNYGAGFHNSDCVGIIIDPYKNQNRGYFFAMNGAGTKLDALIANYNDESLSWDAIWDGATTVQGTDKIYEFQIPLSVISYDENIQDWNFQFYTRDTKIGVYTVWNKFERGFLQFDTRFLKPIQIENLQPSKTKKTIIIPSVTSTYQKDILNDEDDFDFQPSLDLQYKITDGLRIDATIVPDFSQVDVDQQVTNLTRFNIVFPERRNFFIENSDMFTTLGTSSNVTPFYSRLIGADKEILFGLKLSGNVSENTRIGVLNVQSRLDERDFSENYTVAVLKQQFGAVWNASTYFINTQTLEDASFQDEYNRLLGLKVNYLSKNKKWSGLTTFGRSLNNDLSGKSNMFAIENNYNTRKLSFSSRVNHVGQNYLTKIGFVPRLYNYDPINGFVVRQSYTEIYQSLQMNVYPNSKHINAWRYLNANASLYLDESGDFSELNLYYNNALFFQNLMSVYVNFYHDIIDLKYAFDPLQNDNFILPGDYTSTAIRMGFNSDFTKSFYGTVNLQYGSFYGGKRSRVGAEAGWRLLPLAAFTINYEYNRLDFDELGQRNLHLFGLTSEIFFNNKLNWTTYFQYNEQANNFNINSRLQWEYKPLSFLYLVYADNYSESLDHKNWSISLKVNRRLNF